MAITVKHTKVSTVPDSTDTSLVRPSDWNADHTLTGLGTMAEQNANNVTITGGSISGATVAGYIPTTEKGAALGVATLDAGGKVPTSQIPLQGDLNYQGTWNATTNSPTLTSSTGTKGYYYVVDVAGTTNLNGITDWQIGDWAIFNGTVWQKVDNTDAVTSVNGQVGTVVLGYADVGAPSVSGTNATGTWAIDITGNAATATKSTNLASGSTGQIAYQSAPNTTAFVTAGTSGQVLSANAGGIPTWITNTVGDVVGPSSATDNAIARFDTTTGKLIQNSVVTIDDAGNIISPDSVQFSGTVPVTQPSGTLWYDNTNNTLNFQQNAITQQIGEEIFIYGKASAAITEGQLICKTGTVGASGVITFGPSPANLADNDGIIGVATENIAHNGFGRITTFGVVHGINTTGSSVGQTWADNDTLWYNPAGAGTLTNVKPSAPNIKYQVATVINASGGGSGSLQILLQAGTSLGGTDNNAQITSPSNGQLITYDGTGTYFKNTSLTAGTAISVSASSTGVLTVANTAPDQVVSLTGAGTTTISGTYPSFTITSNDQYTGTVTAVTATAPVASTGGTTPVISMAQANGTTNGYLSSTDWTTFNNKQPAGSYLTAVTADAPLSGSGTSGSHLVIATANTTTTGALSSTDWNTFNGKANAFTYTSTYIPYGQGTTTPNQSSSLTFDGTTQVAPIQRASNGLIVNSKTVSASYSIASGDSAMSVGPVTVASGQTVTIASGSRWVVL